MKANFGTPPAFAGPPGRAQTRLDPAEGKEKGGRNHQRYGRAIAKALSVVAVLHRGMQP
jgi:hypothetical protein